MSATSAGAVNVGRARTTTLRVAVCSTPERSTAEYTTSYSPAADAFTGLLLTSALDPATVAPASVYEEPSAT